MAREYLHSKISFEKLYVALKESLNYNSHTIHDLVIRFDGEPPPDDDIKTAVQAALQTNAPVTIRDRSTPNQVVMDVGEDNWPRKREMDQPFVDLTASILARLQPVLPTAISVSIGYIYRMLQSGGVKISATPGYPGWRIVISHGTFMFAMMFRSDRDVLSAVYRDKDGSFQVHGRIRPSRHNFWRRPFQGVKNAPYEFDTMVINVPSSSYRIEGSLDASHWADKVISLLEKPAQTLQDAADQQQDETIARHNALTYRELQQLAKQKGLKANGSRSVLFERVTAPTFTDLAWAPVNLRYNHAVLPRNSKAPNGPDATCNPDVDAVLWQPFEPGDHIVHRTEGTECFKKSTIDRIVREGGVDPVNRKSLRPWFGM